MARFSLVCIYLVALTTILPFQLGYAFSTIGSPLSTSTGCSTKRPSNYFVADVLHLGPSRWAATNRLLPRLTTTTSSAGDNSNKQSPIQRAVQKFRNRPGTYLIIPCVAALVGWFTNWLAVQMIFFPIEFRGIPLYRVPEIPLGFLGWQGIIPCKTRPMTEAVVDMVTTQLLSVKGAFLRLDPRRMADLLAPEVPQLAQEVLKEVPYTPTGAIAFFTRLGGVSQSVVHQFNLKFLEQLTQAIQANIDQVFSLKNCVVDQMMMDRAKLGELFRQCGQKELDFLTNSGLWFGFLLGLIQMAVALFWENPWSLSIGGGIVGLATNWLALKWIFQPVDPVRVLNLFTLQGMFLRRQKEVAATFSAYFARNILTAEQLWKSVLTDPSTRPHFAALFRDHVFGFVGRLRHGINVGPDAATLSTLTDQALVQLPKHVGPTFKYMDKTLGLEDTLRVRMEQMSSRQFERVLHPIFEEDELTLILAGAALGFAAGLVQQGLETGKIKLPNLAQLRLVRKFRVMLWKMRRRFFSRTK